MKCVNLLVICSCSIVAITHAYSILCEYYLLVLGLWHDLIHLIGCPEGIICSYTSHTYTQHNQPQIAKVDVKLGVDEVSMVTDLLVFKYGCVVAHKRDGSSQSGG